MLARRFPCHEGVSFLRIVSRDVPPECSPGRSSGVFPVIILQSVSLNVPQECFSGHSSGVFFGMFLRFVSLDILRECFSGHSSGVSLRTFFGSVIPQCSFGSLFGFNLHSSEAASALTSSQLNYPQAIFASPSV